jgi:superfamily I DNA/RNA helicase
MIVICKKRMQCPKASYGELYQNYVDKCFKSGAMDFDDLLLKTNELKPFSGSIKIGSDIF